ncbi:MAG TPA: hypothetical protein VEX86_23670 [Longimicrobium sp.]|nr:hypothetical protein [Longimicrobium sp.]
MTALLGEQAASKNDGHGSSLRGVAISLIGFSTVVLETPAGDLGSGLFVGGVLLVPAMIAVALILSFQAKRKSEAPPEPQAPPL